MNALWKKRKKGNMTEIKEALFDEEPEKKEEPEKNRSGYGASVWARG